MPFSRDPRFDALRNAIYHTERKAFFDLIYKSLSCIVIVLGASVVGKIADLIHTNEVWIGFFVVVFATLQLVFDFGSRARAHEYLQKRYFEFLAEMDDANLGDATILARWSAKLLIISGEEPMPMRALDALAYNKALSAIYDNDDVIRNHRIRVSWWQRRLRHFFAFHSAEFPTEHQWRARPWWWRPNAS